MQHQKLTATSIAFIVLLFATSILPGHAEQPSVSLKTFAIKHIPFNGFGTTSDISGIPIIFSEYGKMAKVIYPAPKEVTVQDPSSIIKNCQEFLIKISIK